MLLYFVVMPRVYGFSTLGSFWALAALSVPFILATSFWARRRPVVPPPRTAVLIVLSSLPQFFLVGVSGPPRRCRAC
jgi:ABC-2 type transport system permease protein